MIRLALYQPDIAQNLGTILRLGACLGVPIDIIEPCGFPLDDRRLRRAGMDYMDKVEMIRHASWEQFCHSYASNRLLLMTTRADMTYINHRFKAGDIMLFGRESAGVPDEVHRTADKRLSIPMQPGTRSLNVAMSAAMVTGEALRQLGCLDGMSQ